MTTVATFPQHDPFRSHLLAVLSTYENGPYPHSLPHYEGPSDGQTASILRTMDIIARRMYAAENTLSAIQNTAMATTKESLVFDTLTDASDSGKKSGDSSPETNKMRTDTTNVEWPPGAPVKEYNVEIAAVEELRLLKAQVSDVARVCSAVAQGDLTQKIMAPVQGVVMVQLKDIINTMVDKLAQFTFETTRVSLEVGVEGILGSQAHVPEAEGVWKEVANAVNHMAAASTRQVRSANMIAKAVGLGNLNKQIVIDARGEHLDFRNTMNLMVVRLRMIADEVNRVTSEIGSHGRLGVRAHVPDIEGVWFDLVRNLNLMCSAFTNHTQIL